MGRIESNQTQTYIGNPSGGSVVGDPLMIDTSIVGFCNCFMFCLCVTLCPFQFCNHLDGEKRAGCFAKFVFLVSHDCCVALPDHTMWYFLIILTYFLCYDLKLVYDDFMPCYFWHLLQMRSTL